jgi:PAT family beta-lactamase induction signal transducer AmpG
MINDRLNRNILISLFGFISGFTLIITSNSLNFWLAKTNVTSQIIGLASIVGIPYSFNFLWSPIVDKYNRGYLINYMKKQT